MNGDDGVWLLVGFLAGNITASIMWAISMVHLMNWATGQMNHTISMIREEVAKRASWMN